MRLGELYVCRLIFDMTVETGKFPDYSETKLGANDNKEKQRFERQ